MSQLRMTETKLSSVIILALSIFLTGCMNLDLSPADTSAKGSTGLAADIAMGVTLARIGEPVGGSFTVGGTVTGVYTANAVSLLNNGADPINLSAAGSFVFPGPVGNLGSYNVSVSSFDSCYYANCNVVSGGSGIVVGANVTSVRVVCTTRPAC